MTFYSPCSSTPNTISLSDVNQICNYYLEQIGRQFALMATWIVYRQKLGEERQFLQYYGQEKSQFNPQVLAYLESEEWLNGTNQQYFQVPLSEDPQEHPTFVYIYHLAPQTDEYWLLWTDKPLTFDQQQTLEAQVTLLQEYMLAMNAIARHRQEIQFLEQLVQRGKHQLRDPLALIGLYAENLCLGLPEGQFREQAMTIRETVNDITFSLRKLLDIDPKSRPYIALYDLRKIFQELLKVFQPWLVEKQLIVSYPSKELIVAIDRWQIKQVFEILLSNAIDFSPVGGTIQMQWDIEEEQIIITMSDRGSGLSVEDLENVFEPFYSRREGGTGLGLAIAKDIIDNHHGKITANNHPSGGAVFKLTLPRQGTEEVIGIMGEFHL